MAIKSETFKTTGGAAGVTSVNGDSGPAVVLDTSDIAENTNLYYTDARADARIAAANATDLNDVSYTAGAGIDGYVLTYSNTNNQWEAQAASANVGTLQQVTDQGATTTTNIQTAQITLTGDLLASANNVRTIGDETNKFITVHSDLNGAVRFKAKATEALSKGDAIYIDGVSGGVPTVSKAQSNSSATMPAFGLAQNSATINSEVQVITFGNLEGINTGSFSVGDTLYISATTAGGLTNTAPTGEANLIQNIGRVVKVDAVGNSGIYKIGGAGRSNATPNLNNNKIFLGNASNQAVPTALSAVNLSSLNNDLDTSDIPENTNLYYTDARADARIAAANATDLNDVSYTAGAAIDGYVLTYSNTNSQWEAQASASAPVTSVNTQTGAVVLDTSDIAENTNLYYTDARADARIAAANATDLNDVSYTAGAGIDGYVLTYSNTNSQWEAQAASGASNPTVTTASPGTTYAITTHASIEEIYILTPSADISVTLPAAASCGSGYKYNIKNMSSAFTLTIDPNLSETIDGNTTFDLNVQYQSITLVTDGSNWFII